MENIFALADCNNFYVSCERVFKPELKNKPVVILSNNDGCIVSRSQEAKALGIGMGVPFFQVRDIVESHNVKVFSSNYTLYGDISERVMDTLSRFTPNMEYYSIDEAFLSLYNISERNLTEYAKEIRRTVLKHTGIPISIGIAKTKTLAKIANEYVKRNPKLNGVLDINNLPNMDKMLDHVPVYDIWGVGGQFGKYLMSWGIFTALDFRNANENFIRNKMGVIGVRTQMELKEISCLELNEVSDPRKGIMSSRSFSKYVTELDELQEAVSQYTTRAAEKLRKQNSIANNIYVFLQTNIHKLHEMQYSQGINYSLPEPTAFTPDLIRYARALMKKIYKQGYKYIKAGVMLTGIISKDTIQLNVFLNNKHDKKYRLMQSIDDINQYWGRDTVKSASSGIKQDWKMRRDYCSPRYTTNWNELLTIKL